ncbi:MAG: molybdopterin-guanine dinucleotide biosynthesis protein MobB [Desulfobacterales bacterium]|nr:molybdopterin-guanine dinucleotide biosynthesis protein MobB [Desulfobacterales bacterium]
MARGTNSGKTTVMERIIAELARRGRKVAAVKHGLHMHYADKEGKDTQRFALNRCRQDSALLPEGILMYENAPPTVDYLCCVAAAGMDVGAR